MRLYVDQCLRFELAELLRSHGHDVVRAAETGQARADDALVLERAVGEERILITLDEHFGDWVVLPLSKHPGVIRVKAIRQRRRMWRRCSCPCWRTARKPSFATGW